MDTRKFPRLPNHLIAALKDTLPANKPMPGEGLDAIMFRAGQWSLIELLERVEEDQTSHHRLIAG